ncbi:hypothetical protein BU24DRAFT_422330 [Aaosphaeria arxii CBS 175.79]|uniref:DUF7605 domain-containing protein n=1 Tax=Aaosphaeria arxii CBS 175.79 TaxID=1450172 RepID=A0A6A5XSU1_9PLEO|nr:uncharacterized protein BU24DRAFT_422330 [Aaosphaeria arxii CBS 175.79]KAF2016013.1 hypothetical protein BU24DRAFT_422330 [Aaosphaeria arxii CBS 175.79]
MEIKEVHNELLEMKAKYAQDKFKIENFIVGLRNRKIRNEILGNYRDHPASAGLTVFCVSNSVYREYRQKAVADAIPWLNMSNIINLRRHCVGIVAESHLRAALAYMNDDFPAFLGSTQLWLEAGSGGTSAERKKVIIDAVALVQDRLDEMTAPFSDVNTVSEAIFSQFSDSISSDMEAHTRQWSHASRKAAKDWRGWYHTTFAAWCRNYGSHQTRQMEYHCWNEIAIEQMANDILRMWRVFKNDVDQIINRMKADITNDLRVVIEITHRSSRISDAAKRSLMTLMRTIQHRRLYLNYAIECAIDDHQARMQKLRVDLVSSIQSSIIGQRMVPYYKASIRECGGGSDLRKKAIICDDAFGSETLFDGHRTDFRERIFAIGEEFQQAVTEVIKKEVTIISIDLDSLRDDNVIQESERNPRFRTGLTETCDEVQTLLDDIRRVVDSVTSSA